MDSITGHIAGVSGAPGEYHFQIRVSDSQSPPATLAQEYRIAVNNTGEHWQLPPGFTIEAVVSDLHLPVNIAFVPNAGPNPTDPYFYVTLLHGNIVMVQRNFEKKIYATGLLNYNPVGEFPGSGEMGVTGIAVDPVSGDVFAAMVYEDDGDWRNRIVRFHSTDGGHTAATQTTIMSGVAAAFSHQIQALTIGPDGKLYANLGDGWVPEAAPALNDRRGKILRLNLDGSFPGDNPFPNTPIYATGFRNPFGAAWREEDSRLYVSDNGPEDNDRLVKIIPGEDFGWGLESQDLTKGAIYLWNPTVAPVAIDFLKFTAFPPEYRGNLFAALSGPPYWQGPTERGKKIQRFRLDANGKVLSDSLFLDYVGAGKATVIGVAFGPDGLYFTDLYGENGFDEFGQTHGNVYRIRWPSPDSTAPAISNVQITQVNAKRATIAWQTDEAAMSQMEYGLTAAYGNWATRRNIFSTRHQITVTQLLPETVYHFRVWNWDAANNNTVSQDFTFKTLAADSVAPVMSAVRIDSIAANRALVIWQTNEPATSVVDYGRTLNYDLSQADSALVTTHRLWLLNLQDSTRYHLRLRSVDNNDNEARTDDLPFTTLPRQFERRLEAESMPIKTGGSESAPGWVLWDNGYLAENVNFPRAGLHRFTVRAFGRMAAGEWSLLELRIDQETRAAIEVADSNYIELASAFNVTAGVHEVAIAFINEAFDPPEHRYLGVDWLYIQDITTQQIHAAVTAKPATKLPATFALSSYPNPFFTTARIHFSLPQDAEINLTVFDLTGREITTLFAGSHHAGHGELHWDGRNRDGQFLRSGYYFLRLRYRAGNTRQWMQIIQRVVLMK